MNYSLPDYYRTMFLMRTFEDMVLKGGESRTIHGELHLGHGHEAIAAGMAGMLRKSDALVSTHRAHLHAIAKDVPLVPLFAELFERETGLCKGKGGHMHLFAPEYNFFCTGIVGASIPAALGYAYAAWVRERDDVSIGVTGDGGVNTGAFHESLNLAAIWKLPLIVLVENNRYAISVPIGQVVPTPTIAERSCAYNIPGMLVDGSDPEAVADTMKEALDHTRSGKGPVLIEATCLRMRAHWEGDLDLYRCKSEKEEFQSKDPLKLVREKMLTKSICNSEQLETIQNEVILELQNALEEACLGKLPEPSEAFTDVFVDTN
jgi:acetoin:2,6-dichlorophenolindophenol oxidoreductase subunit alpha